MLCISKDALTFDDVLIVPAKSSVLPGEVILKTRLTDSIDINIPVVSSAMDTVTEASLAIALAQEGGIGFIHKNMSLKQQILEINRVKRYESGIVVHPKCVTPNTILSTVKQMTIRNGFAGYPVIVQNTNELIGIITSRDVRFVRNLSDFVSSVMTPKDRLVTVRDNDHRRDIVLRKMHEKRVEKVLLVDDQFCLKGMITAKDFEKAERKPNACKDNHGRLRVGAAVGVQYDYKERIAGLVRAGIDVLLVDSSHGHSDGVLRCISTIRKMYPHLPIIGGNVVTKEGALALIESGVNAVKVGIGPGSICTTRIVTGVGIPQVTAISDVSEALRNTNIPIIADGGIRFSGDIAKAIAAGAHCVMIGSLLAGAEESPGDIEFYQGRSFKTYRGMGSLGAMHRGSADRYFQYDDSNNNINNKLVPEGIEGRVTCKGKLKIIIHQLMGGMRSCMGLTGCLTIDDLRTKAKFVRVSYSGMKESHVHDVTITKESPNYCLR